MKKKNNSLIVQGSILAFAGIITKLIGFIYRIPMANLLGEQGNGIYSVAFGVYNVALTLSSYSLPLAVSKLVSSRLAKNEHKNAYLLFKRAMVFAVIAGTCAFAVLFFGAEWLEVLYSRVGLANPLKVLAPTAFVVALLGVFRGYFQGYSNMVPTAVSQIFEQIINAVVSIIATYLFMKAYSQDSNVFAHGAAGATMGTLAGALGALIMLTLFFVSRIKIIKEDNKNDVSPIEKKSKTFSDIITTMFPIILSQSIYQIGFTVDDLIFGNIMSKKGIDDAVVSSIQGVFNTQYTQLINLPIAIATALAASALPGIVNLFTQGKNSEKNAKTKGVIKLTSVISIPSAIGLAVLSRPIITIMFPILTEYREMAISLLQFGSSACVFYSLATMSTSILQGNNLMKIPVINSFISLVFHVIIISPLLGFTNLTVYALLIGDVTFPLLIMILNLIALKKKTGYTQEIKNTFVLPLINSSLMGIAAYGVHKILTLLNVTDVLSLCVSLVIAVTFYALFTLITQVFSDEELLDLPMGGRILKYSKKIRK